MFPSVAQSSNGELHTLIKRFIKHTCARVHTAVRRWLGPAMQESSIDCQYTLGNHLDPNPKPYLLH